jgi:predicted PurR-regulated permease PerM
LNGDINKIKTKGRFRRFISVILNFLCALVVFFVILFAIGAFMQADVQSKNILGNHDYLIFSYNKTDSGIAELKAFGESFNVDLNKIHEIKKRFDEISAVNKDYTPSLIILTGDIIKSSVSSVGDCLKKIPDIIIYFIENIN